MKTSLGNFTDNILKYEWILLILIAYPMLFPKPEWTIVMLVIPALWILRWIKEGQPLIATPLNLPILLLSILLLVSLWATFRIEFSLPKISGLIFGIGVFYSTVRNSIKDLSRVLLFYLIIGIALSGFGLIATNWPSKIPVLGDLIDQLPHVITSLPSAKNGVHPNELGGILLLFSTPFIWLAWQLRNGYQEDRLSVLSIWAVAIWFTGLLFLTQSRSALFGLGAAIVFLMAVNGRYKPILVTGLMIVVIMILPNLVQANNLSISGLVSSSENTMGDISLAGRLEIWSRAIFGIGDFSITGMGIGTFRSVAPVLYPLIIVPSGLDFAHAHNLFLQTGLDLGILGIISLASIFIVIGASFAKSKSNKFYILQVFKISLPDLFLACISGLLAYLVYSFTDAIALGARPGFFVWILMGISTAIFIKHQSTGENYKQAKA
jgi:putative inorganic carbon (HCO3(-)) transporter